MNFYSILREELNVAHFMPYRRTKRVEARLADTRARILRAARQLVAEGGFREAQVATIAAVAVSRLVPCTAISPPKQTSLPKW